MGHSWGRGRNACLACLACLAPPLAQLAIARLACRLACRLAIARLACRLACRLALAHLRHTPKKGKKD
jgi:hypothetical protein